MNIGNFINRWQNRGYEKGDAQSFWLDLLTNVFGVKNTVNYIFFEQQINGKFIDARIPAAKVLIEQKSSGKDLSAAYEQAKGYDNELPFDKKSRWIVTSDFQSFQVHDMNNPKAAPEIILLKDLEREYYRLRFLVDNSDRNIQREEEISLKVGEIVAKLYDVLKKQYHNPESDESLNNLNKLCVRLVFCMYSESTGIFGKHKLFRDYLNKESNTRVALIRLFKVLNTPAQDRDPYLEKPLSDFPYVNGGLFDDDNSVIPTITDEIKNLIVINAGRIDWSDISPTIFGAIFESTLNPATHKGGGMHYTGIENIHKLIDPLFMDDLREEFEACDTEDKLLTFQNKLAALKFLDPACGSGNFLTETYLSLRRLENEILRKLQHPSVKVSISQFYGIEINDFAVAVAQVALWISELQMNEITAEIIRHNIEMLPLKTNANIIEGNALRVDWHALAPDVDYIIGNPPFSGARVMSAQQKADVNTIFTGWKNIGNLDYVACWYKKAADFINSTNIRAALVSTNSICQGDSVATLWKPLFNAGVHIDFAHRSFKWDSESTRKAHVHCVIVAFSTAPNPKPKLIFDADHKFIAQNINAYLQDAPDIFVESRNLPVCNVPEIGIGNQPIDNGNYLFTLDEMNAFVKKEPAAKKYFKPWYGAEEFLHNRPRYCLWLGDCTPHELQSMPYCLKRIEAVRQFRLNSRRTSTLKLADNPTHFQVENMPQRSYIVIPNTSSGSRKYVPIGFLPPNTIVSNAVMIIPDTNLYHFGVLTSIVHMAWLRIIAGYLGTSYRYSGGVVYNNFPWCNPTDKQRSKIEQTAQRILSVRADYIDSSLADLYNELTMPSELRKAHLNNDRAVMEAYGFRTDLIESEIVAELMRLYVELTR